VDLDAAGTGHGVVSITATDQVNSAPNWAIAWSEDLWKLSATVQQAL
jgi:hypothetical protein